MDMAQSENSQFSEYRVITGCNGEAPNLTLGSARRSLSTPAERTAL